MEKEDLAYLSLLRWPEGASAVEKANALVSILGMDPYQAGLAVRRRFPQVVQRIRHDQSTPLLGELDARGISAFAPTRARMRQVAGALYIRVLRPAIGAPQPMYECEPARGDRFALLAPDIALLVRASVASIETGTAGHSGAWNMPSDISAPQSAVLGAAGLNTMSSARSARTRISEVLDIYLRDGKHLRIDADRFNFDLLGEHRPQTDRQRTDALARRLASEAPGALLDQAFGDFHCPPDLVRTHHAGAGEADARRSAAMAAFDFYSAWTWLRSSEAAPTTPSSPAPVAPAP